jgi:RNA-directed DNA polymerase
LPAKNLVILDAIKDEAEKLVRRHQKYATELAAGLRRREKRSGFPQEKHIHLPAYWAADCGFNPYHVLGHARGIAYAIDKSLTSATYRPRPAVIYSIEKVDGTLRDVDVFQVADNAVSTLTYRRLIEKNSRHFSAHAYAYRHDLTIHDAVLHISSDFKSKSRIFIAEFDFRKFFGSISHDHIHRVLKDERFFITEREHRVIDAFLRAPSLRASEYTRDSSAQRERERGIPRGLLCPCSLPTLQLTR